jgi:hypothetical protein
MVPQAKSKVTKIVVSNATWSLAWRDRVPPGGGRRPSLQERIQACPAKPIRNYSLNSDFINDSLNSDFINEGVSIRPSANTLMSTMFTC